MARPKGPRKIGQYSNEYKDKVVRLTFMEGTQIQEVASALEEKGRPLFMAIPD